MTEQEARKLFRSLAKPAEGSPVPTICMYESEAIEFAKTYADAQVADVTKTLGIAQGKIGELNSDWAEIVAAKDADLKRITHERDVLCEIRDMSYREIATLKADKERMREAIQKEIDIEDAHGNLKDAYSATICNLKALLSPADGDGETVLQSYHCDNCEWDGQVGLTIETEDGDACPKCGSVNLVLGDWDGVDAGRGIEG